MGIIVPILLGVTQVTPAESNKNFAVQSLWVNALVQKTENASRLSPQPSMWDFRA